MYVQISHGSGSRDRTESFSIHRAIDCRVLSYVVKDGYEGAVLY